MVSENNPIVGGSNVAGQPGSHSVPSGLSYTDEYNELVGGLSEELVHRFSLMREQDAAARQLEDEIATMLRTSPDQVSPAKMREKFERLYAQRLRISSEKLAEAKGAYDMVDKLILRLDKDMRKIDEEVRVKESDAGYLASAIAAGTASASVKPEKVLTQLNQPQGGNGVGVANILSTLMMGSEDAAAEKDPKSAGVKRKEPESSSKISKGAPSPYLAKTAVQAPPLYAADEDPHEPKYCLCERVSYGEMIACDNPTCLREWFHFDCVGLEAKPKGKWYCEDCRMSLKRAKTK